MHASIYSVTPSNASRLRYLRRTAAWGDANLTSGDPPKNRHGPSARKCRYLSKSGLSSILRRFPKAFQRYYFQAFERSIAVEPSMSSAMQRELTMHQLFTAQASLASVSGSIHVQPTAPPHQLHIHFLA
jgi:hypothetical protein